MKKIYLASVWMFAISSITVISCSKDDEMSDFCSLDTEFQTPTTRSSQMDFEGANNPYLQTVRANQEYTHQANCCGLTTLVDAWINSKGNDYFSQSGCCTAQQYYDKLVDEVRSNSDYHWTPDSASMPISTFMMLNERFPISSKKNKDGSTTNKNLFSDYITFNGASDVKCYLSDKNNRNNVKGVLLEDENGNGHMAYVSRCTSSKITFTGYDIYNENGYGGGTIGTDGSSKCGWRVKGVLLK